MNTLLVNVQGAVTLECSKTHIALPFFSGSLHAIVTDDCRYSLQIWHEEDRG
ncbi:hypothetical protein [Paenibacillus sp. AR247]|uniref:hypothetical protein n=1 Tax=Paenibacillus sp. AR247 TaxID=1631599 RepID=UPI0015E44451|nr:hypothetical protein [Paenibacillus sp. AR247]